MSVASEIERIQQAKASIKQSAENLGFDIPSSALISNYPQNIQKTPLTLTMSAETDGDTIVIDLWVSPIPSNVWSGFNCYGDWGCCNDNIVNISVNGVLYACNITDGKGNIILPSSYGGDYVIGAVFVSTNYYSNYVTTSVTISGITIDPDDLEIEQFDNKVLVKGLPSDADGVARIVLGGNSFSGYVENSYALIDLSGTPGEYDVEVIYNGDGKYASAITLSTVILPKYDTPMLMTLDNINVGDRAIITVELPDYASGNITVYVTGKDGGTFTSQIIGGGVTATTSAWTVAGTYSVVATYEGDDNCNSSFTTGTFDVTKVTPNVMLLMSGGTYGGESTKFKVYVPNDATGTVTFEVDEMPIDTVDVVNGMVTFTVPIDPGTYDVTAVYNGNDKYYSASTSGTVTVQKAVPLFSISVRDIHVGETAPITVDLQDYASNGNCKIEFPSLGSSFTQTQTVLRGKTTFEVRNLPAGTHSFTVTYLGNDLVSTGSESDTITVS